jgi:hypothetical protein
MRLLKIFLMFAAGLAIASFSVGLARGGYEPSIAAATFLIGAGIAFRALFLLCDL